ncbi:hypothetical protein B0J11DRAFT_509745 [Dendryphion nanum]|uniref:Fucose-specific lectin n=1 Tax=Dendryphion nanum TaxID=256645 RepID=A0A9P9DAB0_9PLEO|nr:hypothetical protein B0J11DRAFT_509745 [Dendryphion nanum]
MDDSRSYTEAYALKSNVGSTQTHDKWLVPAHSELQVVPEEKITIQQPIEQYAYYADPNEYPPPRKCLTRRQIILIIVAISAVIIAVAIAVPIILLQKPKQVAATPPSASSDIAATSSSLSGTQSSSYTASSTPTRVPKPSSIANLSPLAAVSWADGDGRLADWKTRLIYLDDEGYLQASTYFSRSKEWKSTLTRGWIKAKKGSPVTIARLRRDAYGEQVEAFFFDDSNNLRNWQWGPSSPQRGWLGELDKLNLTASPTSPLAAYWPFVFFQNPQNQLHQAYYEPNTTGNPSWKENKWDLSLPVGDSVGSGGIAAVPSAQNLQSVSMFHRNAKGDLVEWVRGYNATAWEINDPPILPSRSLPPTSHFAAFALPPLSIITPSPPPSLSPLTNILLYQSPTDTKIYMLHRAYSSSTSWSSPRTFSAFEGADKGTHIACITGFSWVTVALESEKGVGVGLGKCFFQVGGAVREVEFSRRGDGAEEVDWKVVGWVDME